MTGQTSARHHTTQWIAPEANNAGPFGPPDWQWKGITDKHVTLPRTMQQAGYRTIFCGKAHFGPTDSYGMEPTNFGFDVNIAGCGIGQPGSYYGKENFGNGIAGRDKRGVPGMEAYHGKDIFLTEALTLEINKEISKAVTDKKPFFAYMAHYAVHSPFNPDPRFVGNYPNAAKPLAAFCSLIEGMDKSLGDMLDHLDKLGVADNTLFIFLGDNGSDAPNGSTHDVACAAPLRGKKATHYEGGMRVPCIAAWAKPNANNELQKKLPIQQGAISTSLGAVYDVFPTTLALAGITPPTGERDGIDLAPLLRGEKGAGTDREFLMHFPHSHRSSYFTVYRKGDWKVIYHYHLEDKAKWKQYELFNLANDPYEGINLAEEQPEQLKTMMVAMAAALEKSGALYPLDKDKKTPLKPVIPGK
jgi:arylsulfatase A-like enzyme